MPILPTLQGPGDLRGLSDEELRSLAAEIREYIISTVATTGGHLGSSLGTVELTIALHRVLESPRDKIVWDTGHQAYAHKLLTGRFERFGTLRQLGGIGGFPRRAESEHDVIENSHASTAGANTVPWSFSRSVVIPPGACAFSTRYRMATSISTPPAMVYRKNFTAA